MLYLQQKRGRSAEGLRKRREKTTAEVRESRRAGVREPREVRGGPTLDARHLDARSGVYDEIAADGPPYGKERA